MTIPACFSSFVEGDIVTLSKQAVSNEMGPPGTEFEMYTWCAKWVPEMDSFIGKTFKVEKVSYLESTKSVAVVCSPTFECPISSRWFLPPWCLSLGGTFGAKSRTLEKSELDLVAKFVAYQAAERKKKIVAELSAKEMALSDLACTISVEIQRLTNLYWKTKTGNTTADKNRIMIDCCKKLEAFTSGENSAAVKLRSEEVRRCIEVANGGNTLVEREIRNEVLSVLNRFVNSDIYQSKVPSSEVDDVILRVITDPIVLEYNDRDAKKTFKEDFGPMEIHFSMMAQTIKVFAQKPNYDEHSSARYFHPHVNNHGGVCEGEGRIPISNAIKDGRFTDVFDLVIGILETYNPGSPYCHLRNWHPPKSKCANCGDLKLEANLHRCGKCRSLVCGSCIRECGVCGNYRCPSCISTCPKCGIKYCDGSTSCKESHAICSVCGELVCKNKDKRVVFASDNIAHQCCCVAISGTWVKKSDCFICKECKQPHRLTKAIACMGCEGLVCKECFDKNNGFCKECDEQIKQEEIESFRLSEERRIERERISVAQETGTTGEESASPVEEAVSEAATGSGDGTVRDETGTEEQGEENVSA